MPSIFDPADAKPSPDAGSTPQSMPDRVQALQAAQRHQVSAEAAQSARISDRTAVANRLLANLVADTSAIAKQHRYARALEIVRITCGPPAGCSCGLS